MRKLLAFGCSVFCLACAVQAEPIVWKGGADTSWNTAANWAPATVPNGSGVEADLSAASGTINIASAVTVGNLVFSPTAAKSLTIAGQRLTFAASGVPTVTVGANGTLLTTCNLGGTTGLKKLGAGAFNPKAYNAAGMFSGTYDIAEGTSSPVFKAADGYPGNPIKIEKGATLTLSHADMYGPWQNFEIAGGTFSLGDNGDYVHGLAFSNGGMVKGNGGHLIQDAYVTPQIDAKGDGFTGLYDGIFRINSCFIGPNADYTSINIRTQKINVVNAGATFAMTKRLYEGRASSVANGDIYMREWRGTPGAYRAQISKIGDGDLLLYDNTVTVDGPTRIEAGRLVLSNAVDMAVTKVTADTANKLVIKPGAMVTVGGLDIASGDLDLGGNTVKIGGPNPAVDAAFGGQLKNGTVAKYSQSKQVLANGQSQKDWDVYGGMLGFGLPAPLVRYDFDSAETLGTDSGVLARHLTVMNQNVAWSADGVRGGCAKLSGGYLQCANADGFPSGNTAYTIALWIKGQTGVGGKLALFGWGEFGKGAKCSGFNYEVPKLQHTCWEGGNDIVSGDLGELRGSWHHVAMTFEPITCTRTFYLDGEPVASQTLSASRAFDLTQPFVIGGGIMYSSVFKGEMDEVMLFDRTLSEAQIAALYGVTSAASRGMAFGANGTVRLSRDATLSVSGVDQTIKSVVGAGTLMLDDAVVTVDEASASSLKTVTGRGTLVKTGAGSLAFESATANGGAVDLKGGTLTLKGGCTDATLKSHLVAWWNFDDPANPGRDATGNGLTVGPVQQTDNSVSHDAWDWRNHFLTMGGAAWFDGVDNHHLVLADTSKLSKLPNGNASFTTAAWFNPASNCSTTGGILFWGNGKCVSPDASHKCNGLRLASATTMTHYFWSNDLVSSDVGDIRTGEIFEGWHHVAVTYDADAKQRKIYYDGVQVASDTIGTAKQVEAANFMIGCSLGYQAALQKFTGYIDDVMIFDKALTLDEVQAVSRGFADAPTGGAKVTTAAGTTLSVAAGTVGLGDVAAAGAVSVAADAKLVLAGKGNLGTSLSCPGEVAVIAGGALDLTPGVQAVITTLTLAEGAGFSVTSKTSPTDVALTVSNPVALPAAGKVKLTVPDRESAVKVPLVTFAGGYTGDVSGWTVEVVTDRRHFDTTLEMVDNTLYVSGHARGFMLLVR